MDAYVYIVDDDADVRESLGWLFRARGLNCLTFESAEAYLAYVSSKDYVASKPACVILDIRLRSMSGVALFDLMKKKPALKHLPVLFQTAYADVAIAVELLKKGAFDFFEKPVNHLKLIERVNAALKQMRHHLHKTHSVTSIQDRLKTLTVREKQVMQMVLEGRYNKLIAQELGISMRTVEVHRARLYSKLAVKTAVEMAHKLTILESIK